jgi:ceramide glucosyltransferase
VARALILLGIFGLCTSTAYLALVFAAIVRFRRRRQIGAEFTPPVSLLKPLHGVEPGLKEYLESFFRLDYPEFEILFCARNDTDAGLLIAKDLASAYPHVRTKFLTSGEPPWPNARCFSLSIMNEVASHDILVITDSDVRVAPNYLCDVIRPFREAAVGLVTCVYRGVATRGGFWAKLEALGMSVEMTSGVLVAEMLEGMRFALGPSMIVRKKCVEQIGGFAALGSYYADDFMLGNLVAAHGHTVVLSQHVIDHCIVNTKFRKSIDHQLNWMKSTRFSRPAGHLGTVLVFSAPFGIAACLGAILLGFPVTGLSLLAGASLLRVLQAAVVGQAILADRETVRASWLYPLRDLLGFMIWAASYFSREVGWRDDTFVLTNGGEVTLVPRTVKQPGDSPHRFGSSAD